MGSHCLPEPLPNLDRTGRDKWLIGTRAYYIPTAQKEKIFRHMGIRNIEIEAHLNYFASGVDGAQYK